MPPIDLFGKDGDSKEAQAQQVVTKTLTLLDKEAEKIDLETELLRLLIAKEKKCADFCQGATVTHPGVPTFTMA